MADAAKAFEQVVKARDDHDANCRYKGKAVEVHIHPESLASLGWEDGDMIAGLTVKADEKVAPKRLRVYCDFELHGQGLSEEEAEELLERDRGLTSPTSTPAGMPA